MVIELKKIDYTKQTDIVQSKNKQELIDLIVDVIEIHNKTVEMFNAMAIANWNMKLEILDLKIKKLN